MSTSNKACAVCALDELAGKAILPCVGVLVTVIIGGWAIYQLLWDVRWQIAAIGTRFDTLLNKIPFIPGVRGKHLFYSIRFLGASVHALHVQP